VVKNFGLTIVQMLPTEIIVLTILQARIQYCNQLSVPFYLVLYELNCYSS